MTGGALQPRDDRSRSCTSKVAYSDLDAAWAVVEHMMERHPGQTFNAYVCRFDPTHCHVGHVPTVWSSYR